MDRLNLLLSSLPYLIQGAWITLNLSAIALSMGLALGVPLAIARTYGGRLLSTSAALYSLFFRSLPLLVTMFIFFFVVARAYDLSAFASCWLALGMRSAAYQSEIFRGSIQSVGVGQMVAARALGMSRFKAIRHVVGPQAMRLSLPGWSNEAAVVLKDSSLAYAIGVTELLRRAEYVSVRTNEHLTILLSCAAIYFVMTYALTHSLGRLHGRWKMRF